MLSHLKVHSFFIFFKYRKCHHNKLLEHITSILGRGPCLLIELDAKRMGRRMTQAQRNGGKRSREQQTKTLWHSGNRREWEHKVVASDLCCQAYQQRARRRARCQIPSVSNYFLFLSTTPLPPLWLFFLMPSFNKECTMNKRGGDPALPFLWQGFQLLKGTLFMFRLWFAGTPVS